MIVKLRYKTESTPEGKHKVVPCESIKEATLLFKGSTEKITKAWLTRFDGYKDVLVKNLK